MRPSVLLAFVSFISLASLSACSGSVSTPAPLPSAAPSPTPDTQTITRIQQAARVVFVVPFSHWDTDWHDSYASYVQRSDGNILAAIQMAKQDPRYRYTLEQVLFVQHFWEAHPEARADLTAAIQRRQITFAWAGIAQPETSLTAPAIQVRNLQLGEDWIASTFGSEYIPHTAWQSDAFGNSAAFPIFLQQAQIPYLFICRNQARCDPDYESCQQLPYAFYWTSPVTNARVLVAYLSYPTAWDGIHMLPDEASQLASLHKIVDSQFQRTDSKYILLPMGSDFIDPLPNILSLMDKWNAADSQTLLVLSDPGTAFQYLTTQQLPEITIDMNPIWQAFYATRPEAKVDDKLSAFYLTALDKFGLLTDAPVSAAWPLAAMNAHYDNIGAVSFDNVWQDSQQPRFQQAVETAATDLTATLTRITSGVQSPLVVFNSASWPRSEVVEVRGAAPDASQLPGLVQRIAPNDIAFRAEAVPPIGFSAPSSIPAAVQNPTSVTQSGTRVTLTNGLVTATLDAAQGGTLSSLQYANHEFISGNGDDIAFFTDRGDVYGSFFGPTLARESEGDDVSARVAVQAQGPLVARVQVMFEANGIPITKTVTLHADSPRVDVTVDVRALPNTTVLVQTPTTLDTQTRTDDLGFAPFTHTIDARPIISGDVTYRREIFYPVVSWADVSANGYGLTLVTQGLQGISGAGTLSFMLTRDVVERDEGVTDLDYHTLRYAYWPHAGAVNASQAAQWAYEFNQPLIPVWRTSGEMAVQLPFENQPRLSAVVANARAFTTPYSLLAAQNGILVDLIRRNGVTDALVLDYDPGSPPSLVGAKTNLLPGAFINLTPVQLP